MQKQSGYKRNIDPSKVGSQFSQAKAMKDALLNLANISFINHANVIDPLPLGIFSIVKKE